MKTKACWAFVACLLLGFNLQAAEVDLLAVMPAKNKDARGLLLMPARSTRDFVSIPYAVPKEYDLKLIYTRSDEVGKFQDFIVVLPRGNESVSWCIRYRPDGVIGIGFQRQNKPWFQGTLSPQARNAKQLTILLQVRNQEIRSLVNGELVATLRGEGHGDEFHPGTQFQLHPGPYRTSIHSIRLLEVTK